MNGFAVKGRTAVRVDHQRNVGTKAFQKRFQIGPLPAAIRSQGVHGGLAGSITGSQAVNQPDFPAVSICLNVLRSKEEEHTGEQRDSHRMNLGCTIHRRMPHQRSKAPHDPEGLDYLTHLSQSLYINI